MHWNRIYEMLATWFRPHRVDSSRAQIAIFRETGLISCRCIGCLLSPGYPIYMVWPCDTGLLCGEFTGHRWIPFTKTSNSELWWFFLSAPEPTVEETMETPVILRHHRAHYDVTVTSDVCCHWHWWLVTCWASWPSTIPVVYCQLVAQE